MSSLLLSNGHIVDGTGQPVFQGDVQIEGNNNDEIVDKAIYQAPHRFPQGIVYVIVNGEFVIRDGRGTGHLPGRVLRKTV